MASELFGPGVSSVPGPTWLELVRDREGYRTYTIYYQARTSDALDGPATVMLTPGLPTVGSIYQIGNDIDTWVWCTPELKVTPRGVRGEGNTRFWDIEITFSNQPVFKRCQDTTIDDPLLEPPKISGSFVKYTEEVQRDRYDRPIWNSSHEQFRGPEVEFDKNRPTVRIEQNVLNLELDVFADMVDTVNDATLWGLAARKIKLSNASWERLVLGTCGFYYKRIFDFDVNFKTFDRKLVDVGKRTMPGKWNASTKTFDLDAGYSEDNPSHRQRAVDMKENVLPVPLDGHGAPLKSRTSIPAVSDPFEIVTDTLTGLKHVARKVEYYPESNFLLLGIPLNLG